MSYFAQNGMKIYVDGGLNGPDDPPTIDLGKYFGNLGGASIAPGFVESYLERQYGDGSGDPNLIYDPDRFTPEQLSAIDEGIDNFYKQKGLGRYSESSVTPVKSEDEGVMQMRRDIEASNRAAEERQLSFADRLGDAARGFMGMFDQTEGEQKPVRAVKEPTTQEAPADSSGFSTDALIAGLASVESSTNVTNPDELASEFEKKKDLRSELGSSAVGPLQYIPSYFSDYGDYPNQLAFERARIEEGVSGERDLKSWGQDQFDRYSSDLGPEKVAALEDALGHKLSPADFIWGAHLGGFQWPREIMAAYRDGKIDAQGVVDSKPTPNNASFGQYTSGAYKAASNFQDANMKSEGGMMRVTKESNPTGDGGPTEPEKDYYSSVEAKLQEMTGKPLKGLQNIQGFDWQKADALSSEELGVLNDLVTSIGGGTEGDTGNVIANAKENLPQIREQIGALEEKGIVDPRVAVKSILKEKGAGRVKTYTIMKLLEAFDIINPE